MHTRLATLNDLEAVAAAITALATEQRAAGSLIDPTASAAELRRWLAERIVGEGVIVAESSGTVVGVVTCSPLRDGLRRTEPVGIVEYLHVDPEHRDEGIGSDLLRRAEEHLADRGVAVVELEVLTDNEEARRFYTAQGYRPRRLRLAKWLTER